MATKKQKELTVEFSLDKETKGTRRYKEDEEDRAKQVMGTAYIKKAAAEKLGNPDSITVTIEAA